MELEEGVMQVCGKDCVDFGVDVGIGAHEDSAEEDLPYLICQSATLLCLPPCFERVAGAQSQAQEGSH